MSQKTKSIAIGRALRSALGILDEPGTCRDCGGSGVVPDIENTRTTGPGLWQVCPTCTGGRQGGIA